MQSYTTTASRPLDHIATVTGFHRAFELPKPEHPLFSVIDSAVLRHPPTNIKPNFIVGIYYMSLQISTNVAILSCTAPGKIANFDTYQAQTIVQSGWMILIHPDFLWKKPLAKQIAQYYCFKYGQAGKLTLSRKEAALLSATAGSIANEYHANIDKFSRNLIIAQLEVMLNYIARFHQRQSLKTQ